METHSPSWPALGFVPAPRGTPQTMVESSNKELRQDLLERLIDAKLTGPTLQLSFQCNPQLLPMKRLPHGNWANLYLMYRSYVESSSGLESTAGRSLFYDVARKWKVCLRFHKPSVHSICTTCSTIKARLADATVSWLGR